MSRAYEAMDISDLPEGARLAEEVRQSRTPRELRRGNEVIATIVPPSPLQARLPAQRRIRNVEADLAAIRASGGSWKGLVDAEQLKKEIKEARGSDRPDATL